jgi:hypothetical protein
VKLIIFVYFPYKLSKIIGINCSTKICNQSLRILISRGKLRLKLNNLFLQHDIREKFLLCIRSEALKEESVFITIAEQTIRATLVNHFHLKILTWRTRTRQKLNLNLMISETKDQIPSAELMVLKYFDRED